VLGEILENTRMLNSRIRRLEHETERSRIREIDIPMSIIHEEAVAMAKAGMSAEMLLDRFSNRLSKNALKELVSIFERTKSGELI
jgi:hypothetical protein